MDEAASRRSGTRGRGHLTRENLLIVIAAATIGLIYGYDLGAIATAIIFLQPDFGLSSFMVSVVTTAVVVGQLFGALSAGRISNRIGRKNTMIAVALGYAVFAGLQGLAPNEWFLTVVRFLLGIAIGISIVVAPAYIAESAPVSVRGSMLVTFQIATTSGIAVAYFVGAALAGTESWRLILSLAAIPAIIVLILVIRLPETARGLMMGGRREEAIEVLRRVDPDMDAEEEADIIERDLSYEEQGSFSELFRGRFRRAGIFVVGLGFLVQITGMLLFIVAFNFGYGSLVWAYASESFPARLRTQGGSAMLSSDLLANIIVGVVFLSALGALGGSLTFGIFLVLSSVAFFFVYALAPEVKGRQLEDIRAYWYNGGRWPEEGQEETTVGVAGPERP